MSLKFIRKIRDEVHRFGISFHRNKRSRGTFKNELENIKGIGKQTADQLLKTFHSVNKVKAATDEELTELSGIQNQTDSGIFFKTGRGNAGGIRI